MNPGQPKIERIIVCDKCDNHLWKFKILSYFTGKTYLDAKVGSTQWESANPQVITREPEDWNCPICKREFVFTHKSGKKQMKQVDPDKGTWSREWIS